MADLFGAWVPDDWIGAVCETLGSCPRHAFQFLTRNPVRYASLDFPANAWCGTPVDRASALDRVDAPRGLPRTTFVMFEPLVEEVDPDLAVIGAVQIGARTQPRRLPPRAWVDRVVTRAREAGAAVFMKDNPARLGRPLLRESGRHGPAPPRRLSRALRAPGRAPSGSRARAPERRLKRSSAAWTCLQGRRSNRARTTPIPPCNSGSRPRDRGAPRASSHAFGPGDRPAPRQSLSGVPGIEGVMMAGAGAEGEPVRAVLVVVAGARRGQRLFLAASQLLEARGIWLAGEHLVDGPAEALERVRSAVNNGVPLVIVGGGDGTIRAVLPAVAGQEVVLGILPLGTANNFARSVGVPMDLVGAVDAIASGRPTAVDLGVINGELFANNLSIGYSREIVSATPHGVKRWLGALAYVFYEAGYILRQRLFCCTVATDAGSTRFLTRHIMAVNGTHYGTRPIAPDARLDDGLLDLFALASLSRWQGIRFWARFILGRHLHDPELRRFRAARATITADPPRPVMIDGERGPMTPVEVSVAPAALRVMAPLEPVPPGMGR